MTKPTLKESVTWFAENKGHESKDNCKEFFENHLVEITTLIYEHEKMKRTLVTISEHGIPRINAGCAEWFKCFTNMTDFATLTLKGMDND